MRTYAQSHLLLPTSDISSTQIIMRTFEEKRRHANAYALVRMCKQSAFKRLNLHIFGSLILGSVFVCLLDWTLFNSPYF